MAIIFPVILKLPTYAYYPLSPVIRLSQASESVWTRMLGPGTLSRSVGVSFSQGPILRIRLLLLSAM